ncbi:MAG TPA: response regulator [Pyrinomonadaceae bacterium]|jgi:DNA-binding NtrC family response regulator|nr:response regulator [Pyrinomonadaceae bacterium]
MAVILLIDDNRVVRETLRNVFSERYECHTADRAEQALQLLEFQNYDLVITDVSMPGLGGLDVLRHIKLRHAIPVIVISGRPEMYEDAALESGAFAFISKPFRLEQLETTVAQALAQRPTESVRRVPRTIDRTTPR